MANTRQEETRVLLVTECPPISSRAEDQMFGDKGSSLPGTRFAKNSINGKVC